MIACGWLLAIALAGIFCFNYTPIAPVMGPANPIVQPGVAPVAPLVLSAPDVVLNQAAIDAAKSSALYTQVIAALILFLGSAVLMFVRHYKAEEMKAVPVLMGAASLAIAAAMLGFGWVPSEVLPSAFALLAIAGAAAGPVLQLTAPDQKLLDELNESEEEIEGLEADLEAAEEEIEKSLKVVEGLKKGLETAKAEAKAIGGKVADAEKNAQQAVDRADIAEKTATEAESARHSAESAQATAEAEATTLRERTADAEARTADTQVRLSSFEERKVADQAASALSVAEEDLVDRMKRVTSIQSDLQVAEAEQQRLQAAHQSAVGAADASWTAVEEAAKAALTTEDKLAEVRKSSSAAAEAIANGVKILDSDGLAQQLADADVEHGKAADALTRLNSEARNADVSTGRMASDLQSVEMKIDTLSADLEMAKSDLEAAKVAVEEATKIADSAEIEAVAAKRRFAALVAAEQQSAELTTKIASERAEKEALVAQNTELKDAVKDALRASGCMLSLNRFFADEDIASYRVELRLPQPNEVTFAVRIEDDEGEEMLFRTIPAGAKVAEPFDVDRGFNSKIRILPPGQTADALGTSEIVPYLVA